VFRPVTEKKSTAGRKPIDVMMMFRMLVLRSIYNYSTNRSSIKCAIGCRSRGFWGRALRTTFRTAQPCGCSGEACECRSSAAAASVISALIGGASSGTGCKGTSCRRIGARAPRCPAKRFLAGCPAMEGCTGSKLSLPSRAGQFPESSSIISDDPAQCTLVVTRGVKSKAR
jgi:hypothetical protein